MITISWIGEVEEEEEGGGGMSSCQQSVIDRTVVEKEIGDDRTRLGLTISRSTDG